MSHSTYSSATSAASHWPVVVPDPLVDHFPKVVAFVRRWKSAILTTLLNVFRAALFLAALLWPWETAE
jgi:hypothetical protein